MSFLKSEDDLNEQKQQQRIFRPKLCDRFYISSVHMMTFNIQNNWKMEITPHEKWQLSELDTSASLIFFYSWYLGKILFHKRCRDTILFNLIFIWSLLTQGVQSIMNKLKHLHFSIQLKYDNHDF